MSDETDSGDPDPAWKRRRMVRGRWRDADEDAERPARADRVLSMRLTEAELAEFDAQIAQLGLKRNRALRIAARRIGGFVETDAETLELLRGITRTLGGIATNINQIAKAANRTREPAYRSFLEERKALGLELARLQAVLSPLADVSQRRTDGLARLRKAVEK